MNNIVDQKLQTRTRWHVQVIATLEEYQRNLEQHHLMTTDTQQALTLIHSKLMQLSTKEQDSIVFKSSLNTIRDALTPFLEQQRHHFIQKLHALKQPIIELETLRDKSQEVLQPLLDKVRLEQAQHLEDTAQFQAHQNLFQKNVTALHGLLDIKSIDVLLDTCQNDMMRCWTTWGMQQCIATLIIELHHIMHTLAIQANQSQKTLEKVYQHFPNEVAIDRPKIVAVTAFIKELEQQNKRVKCFRYQLRFALMQQGHAVQQFRADELTHIHDLFLQLYQALNEWLAHALEPLIKFMHTEQEAIEKRLNHVQKISHSQDTLQTRIAELEHQGAVFAGQLTLLRTLRQQVRHID